MDLPQENIKVQSDDLAYVVDFVKSKINTYDIQAGPMNLRFYYFESDNPNIEQAFDEIRSAHKRLRREGEPQSGNQKLVRPHLFPPSLSCLVWDP